jgi:hypothetical protein
MPEQSPLPEAAARGRRATRYVAGALVMLASLIAAGLWATAPPAYAEVATAAYAIGTPTNAVAGVVVSPATLSQSAPTPFVVKFRATAALSGTGASSVTITSSAALASAPTSVSLIDDTDTACFQGGSNGGPVGTTTLTIDLIPSCTVATGDEVEVDFTASGPATIGDFALTVTTSSNESPGISNTLMVEPAPPTISASSVVLGANATYTLSDASWSTVTSGVNALILTAKATAGTTISWYSGASGYSVTFTPPRGTPTADPVEAVQVTTTATTNDTITLTLAAALAAGDQVTISGRGTNPSATSTDVVSVSPETGSPGSWSSAGTPESSTNSLVFGTLVSDVTVAPSPSVAGALATYVVSFQATSQLSGTAGAQICLSEPSGPTAFATEKGALVSDTTAGWHFIASGVAYSAGNPASNPGCDEPDNGLVIPITAGYGVNPGDSVTVTLVGVTNPSAGTVADFTAATSADTVAVAAAPYAIGASSSRGVVVSVNPSTTGSLATYTISDLEAGAPLAGGTSTVTLQAPPGTVFPNNPGSYTVQDSTTPSGSGSVSAPLSGGGTNDVTITVPASINAGDLLDITVEDAINPSSASSAYTITLLGNVTGPPAVAPFPDANVSYPNGAIIGFSGKDYVFAGGSAFQVQAPSALAALQKVDRATVQPAPPGARPPTGAPRPGTLLFTRPIDGTATIYVVGSDGELHGFATPKQFLGDGYDPALVVTVTSLGQLGVGASAGSQASAGNAFSTTADGAVVASSGAFYVFAGGRAFGIPTAAKLAAVRKTDKARALKGQVSPAQTSAVLAGGELLTISGTVYVSYQGDLYPFKSMAQLRADGYGGTAALPAPSTGGAPVVFSYSGT